VWWPNLTYYLGTCLKVLTVSTHNSARPAGFLAEIVIVDVQKKQTECNCFDCDAGCEVSSPSRATWNTGHLKARGAFILHVT
jgi:hypothetical protein